MSVTGYNFATHCFGDVLGDFALVTATRGVVSWNSSNLLLQQPCERLGKASAQAVKGPVP